jgi:anti-sigma regulatory factor (Ser/Thr protein kinase)
LAEGPDQVAEPVTQMSWGRAAGGDISHEAAYYDSPEGYLRAVLPFVTGGLAAAEPVLLALPPGSAGLIASGLDGQSSRVTFADMAEVGSNPGRIISAVWEFLDRHPGQRVRFVGEPFWPERSVAEAREVVRHEALINLAFAAAPVRVLCPYDTDLLAPRIIASAGRTHPVIATEQGRLPSRDYAGGRVPRACARPLPRPPRRADVLAYAGSLQPVREFAAGHAERSGLDPDRTADFVLAVAEVAANTLRHASGTGTAHIWVAGGELICQVTDQGRIRDPLVGRKRPPEATGLGLWVVHQVCDLVELRSGRSGTAVRMRMRVPAREHGSMENGAAAGR